MDEYKFKLVSNTEYSEAYFVEWHEFDNTIQIRFEATNNMYKKVLDMISKQERQKVKIDVYDYDEKIIRYFDLLLLPLKLSTPNLYSDFDTSVLSVTFKVISSELNFVDSNE